MKFIIALVLVLVVTAYADQEDWYRWRGPAANGISSETEWHPSALTKEPRIVWKFQVGKGHSTVVIRGDYLYITGNVKNKDIIYCLNADNGKEVWQYTYDCKAGSFPGPRCTPVLDGSLVYTFSRAGQLFCLEANNGKLKWKVDIAAKVPVHGFSSSPCIVGDIVVVNAGEYGMAFHKATGEKVWGSNAEIPGGYASAVQFKYEDRQSVAILGHKALTAVDITTGKSEWAYSWENESHVNAADPVVADGCMFIASYEKCALLDINAKEPKMIWENKSMKNLFSSSVLLGGYLYGFDYIDRMKGKLKCIEFKTGVEKWAHDLGFGSLIAADGKLIILNEAGRLFIVEATPEAYNEIASSSPLPHSKRAKYWSAPVLCRGKIYCNSNCGDLCCIDVSIPASKD